MAIELTSRAFENGSPIPMKHTCDGGNASPALSWTGCPEGTKTLALIADDPDAPAGTFVHWVLFNLPGNEVQLPEDVHRGEVLPQKFGGALQGKNDFRRIGYGGPCPPPGTLHRYLFKLYALDATVPLKAGATKKDLEGAMQGHILATAELMGTYTRQRLSSAAH